jgi:hypothetical protein
MDAYLDWNEEEILAFIRTSTVDAAKRIVKESNKVCKDFSKDQQKKVGKIAGDAIVDLLLIYQHRQAQKRCKNYTLTYEELCKRI